MDNRSDMDNMGNMDNTSNTSGSHVLHPTDKVQNATLKYYNENAADFCAGTLHADMSHLYDKFLCHILPGGRILDLGCGSGRDSKIFLEKGYQVTAVDGSVELCRLASEYIGQPVRCMDFEELDYEEAFDGIWACASLLHVEKSRIPSSLRKIHRALVPGGVLYVSFKRGEGERTSGLRFFNDCTEAELEDLFTRAGNASADGKCAADNPACNGAADDIADDDTDDDCVADGNTANNNIANDCAAGANDWEIIEIFTTGDVREGRDGEQWVNGVVRKTSDSSIQEFEKMLDAAQQWAKEVGYEERDVENIRKYNQRNKER